MQSAPSDCQPASWDPIPLNIHEAQPLSSLPVKPFHRQVSEMFLPSAGNS